jgi:poly(ADP-ribose) glycohydrolase
VPNGVLTFSRKCLTRNKVPSFAESTKNLAKVLIFLDGTIEDCAGALQLDFANKYLGGGVLNTGCVQEEIRFMICPELLVSMLFTEQLETNEAVIIKGCERSEFII